MDNTGLTSNSVLKDIQISATKRLIVLVPPFPFNELALGKRIWDLALTHRSQILFLGVVSDLDGELRALHQMAALYAATQDRRICVKTQLQFGLSWEQAIRRIWEPGDVVICAADHQVRVWIIRHKPLGSLLANDLHLPVCVLS